MRMPHLMSGFKRESNIKSFPIVAECAVFSDFSTRLADYMSRVEINLRFAGMLFVYHHQVCACLTSWWDVIRKKSFDV